MSLPLVPTTELEAVNAMLASIGEAPVNQLDNTGLGDAATARQRLHETSRRVQMRGWAWNTDYNLTLALAADGTIPLPTNLLKVKGVGSSAKRRLVARGNQLYDPIANSFQFVTSVTAEVTYFLPFEVLSEVARQAIFKAASAVFQSGFLGSGELDKFTARDAQVAWAELISEELEETDCNMLTDSVDMVMALDRTSQASWNR